MNFNGILPELLRKPFLLACSMLLLLNSCKRTETLETLTIDELVPLTVGKYITYRLDSLVFTNAGKAEEIHRYQVKHVVDRESTDNLGRPAWVIATYLNDSVASGQWVQNGTYTITKVDKRLEVSIKELENRIDQASTRSMYTTISILGALIVMVGAVTTFAHYFIR